MLALLLADPLLQPQQPLEVHVPNPADILLAATATGEAGIMCRAPDAMPSCNGSRLWHSLVKVLGGGGSLAQCT
jgi:hypothetical protein